MNKHNMRYGGEKENFIKITNKLITERKYGEGINYLQKIINEDKNNTEALTLMEQIKK